VQPSYGARLAPVLAREDHHVSTSLVHKPPERVIRGRHDGTPARGVRRALVEALDEREEVAQLGALARVDEHLVGRARLRNAQGQGGVEVARVEEEQRVHGCPGMVPQLFVNALAACPDVCYQRSLSLVCPGTR
jgi:hypothetical protein